MGVIPPYGTPVDLAVTPCAQLKCTVYSYYNIEHMSIVVVHAGNPLGNYFIPAISLLDGDLAAGGIAMRAEVREWLYHLHPVEAAQLNELAQLEEFMWRIPHK